MKGRKIKREFQRTEILSTRISKEHKELINDLINEFDSNIVSQADIIEFALKEYAIKNGTIKDWFNKTIHLDSRW